MPLFLGTEHIMANPLSYPVLGTPVPVTVNEPHKQMLCRSLPSTRGIVAALSTQMAYSLGYKP